MKKTFPFLLLATCITLLYSCNSPEIFDKTHEFTSAWNRFEPETFTVDVKNNDDFYDFYLTVVVDTARYHANTLPLIVNIESPAGERRMFPTNVTLHDKKGVWRGEWHDGLLVVDQRIRDCFSFNRNGTYTVKIGQGTHYYDINGIRSIRFHIATTVMELPE